MGASEDERAAMLQELRVAFNEAHGACVDILRERLPPEVAGDCEAVIDEALAVFLRTWNEKASSSLERLASSARMLIAGAQLQQDREFDQRNRVSEN